jgi:ABC-type multidrug transport system fused ATPase/permease subunit
MTNPYFSLMKTAWLYAGKDKKLYVLIYVLFILASATLAFFPIVYGKFINAIQEEGFQHLHYAWLYAGVYMLLKFIHWIFHGPARVWERKVAFNLSRNFLQELYHQTLHLTVRWHQDHHSGSTINRIRKAYEAVKEFFQNGFMYLYTLSKFVFSFAAMIFFSPLFGTIGVMLGILTVWLIFKFDKPFIKAIDETNEKEHIVSSTLFDSLSNIITVITLRLETRMESRLLKKITDVFRPFMRGVIINEWKWFVADTLVGLIYAVTVVGYVYQNWKPGEIFMIGNLVALLGFVNQFTIVFQNVAWQYAQIVQLNTDVQTARFIPKAYKEQRLPEKASHLPSGWRRITIGSLNFSHAETYSSLERTSSLHNISITIERGKRIALVGESGSGKSTLMALLRGLYCPDQEIRVAVDGINTSINSIVNSVTLFPQEPEIFENTIEHNITLGLPFEENDIMEVCKTAQFDQVVQQLPNGLQSDINEKGVNLSGGQRQRLALARGILAAKGSDIILLDEPTSSVDFKTENQIYQNLFEEYKEKAVISSLHRLYMLKYFDYIYVLQHGHIVDEGTFAELKLRSTGEAWKHHDEKSKVN